MTPTRWLSFALLLLGTVTAPAQVTRLELGRRLRVFEREFARTAAPERRAAACRELEQAVRAFFLLDTAAVAAAVARARWALRTEPVDPAEGWAAAMQLELDARLVDAGSDAVGAVLSRIGAPARSEAEGVGEVALPPAPADLRLRVTIGDGERSAGEFPVAVAALPLPLRLPLAGLPAGDHAVRWRLEAGGRTVADGELGLSTAAGLDARLAALPRTADDAAPTIEAATLPHLGRLLRGMQKARGEETILPGARLLAEAEALAALPADGRFYGPERPGHFWLRVPTEAGARIARVHVPKALAQRQGDDAVPLVVALHGAGGSENIFCDGYGDGEIVRQCDRRGWLLVTPRAAGIAMDVPAIVDALAARWPIDRARVFAVGHSMGAMQLVASVPRAPTRFCAVAALSGGGRIEITPGLASVPFLVAAGARDFGLPASRALHQQLRLGGARVEFLEYPDVEHLAIVQVALPDVFAFFDRHVER